MGLNLCIALMSKEKDQKTVLVYQGLIIAWKSIRSNKDVPGRAPLAASVAGGETGLFRASCRLPPLLARAVFPSAPAPRILKGEDIGLKFVGQHQQGCLC